jgi:hypothetical protein
MQKLSDSEIPVVLPILFKIIDVTMLCWNIYLLMTTVVLGWIFSTKGPLDWKHKLLVTVLYCLVVGINSLALYKMYHAWLPPTLADLKKEASTLDETTPGIKQMLQKDPSNLFILGGRWLIVAVDLIAIPAMMFCIWKLK